MITKENIIDILQECYDPEIPIDLWNLGLIYDITIKQKDISILMTLTTPGCSMAQYMADDIKDKIETLDNKYSITVNTTFDPPWEPTMMTDKGKKMLGFNNNKKYDDNDTEWE